MPRKKKPKPPFGLTKKETDVVTLMCYGYSQPQVADALGLATVTVRETLQRVYRKTECNALVVAALKLERAGLLAHVDFNLIETGETDVD